MPGSPRCCSRDHVRVRGEGAALAAAHLAARAAVAAPPPAAVLMMAVVDKVGTFGMIRYCLNLFGDAAEAFAPLIIALAVISIIYGALVAIGQTDILRLIAYTSISHFGFIVLGIFAMSPQSKPAQCSTWSITVFRPRHCSSLRRFSSPELKSVRSRTSAACRRWRPNSRCLPRRRTRDSCPARACPVHQRVPGADRHIRRSSGAAVAATSASSCLRSTSCGSTSGSSEARDPGLRSGSPPPRGRVPRTAHRRTHRPRCLPEARARRDHASR